MVGRFHGECYCYQRNVQDLFAGGKSLYERSFGELFTVPIIPFGAKVEYHPISTKYQARIHQCGKNVFSGLSAQNAGGSWKGDLLFADVDAFQEKTPKENIFCIFPCANGSVKLAGKRF